MAQTKTHYRMSWSKFLGSTIGEVRILGQGLGGSSRCPMDSNLRTMSSHITKTREDRILTFRIIFITLSSTINLEKSKDLQKVIWGLDQILIFLIIKQKICSISSWKRRSQLIAAISIRARYPRVITDLGKFFPALSITLWSISKLWKFQTWSGNLLRFLTWSVTIERRDLYRVTLTRVTRSLFISTAGTLPKLPKMLPQKR